MLGMTEDWNTKPLAFVDKIFQSNLNDEKSWPKAVEAFFQEKAEKLHDELDLASINETPNHLLVDGQIVKFRCMIQDMFDPEYYMDKYERFLSQNVNYCHIFLTIYFEIKVKVHFSHQCLCSGGKNGLCL